MKTVMAQGVFDIIHPGHLHYLRKSRELGDRLVVIIARDSRIKGRKELAFSEDERQEIVESLETVDKAILGTEGNIYDTVNEVDPDIITLGYDQDHDEDEVEQMAVEATGHEVDVQRIKGKGDYSSSIIKSSL